MDRDQEDFAAKLTLIDREANLVLEDLLSGATRERVQHIAMLARLLRLRLDVASSVILPALLKMTDNSGFSRLRFQKCHAGYFGWRSYCFLHSQYR